jgi:ribosomal protein L40E
MVKRGNKKFCPKCGAQNSPGDAYCIRCGHSFRRGKKSNFRTILIVIIVLIAAWILLRTYLNKSIIPTELVEFIKNMTSSKTGQ